jgi:hypothetical protein
MGGGQTFLHPDAKKTTKTPHPRFSTQKSSGAQCFSTFYGPMTAPTYETCKTMSTAFKHFFEIFFGGVFGVLLVVAGFPG